MKLPAMAGTFPFAHLLGLPTASRAEDKDEKNARRAEDETPEDKNDPEDKGDKDPDADAPEDDKNDPEDEKRDDAKKGKAKGNRADDDGGDDGATDDDEDGDDDSDGADMNKKGSRAARLRERSRCAAIFKDKAAGTNPALAATLAFSTDMPRGQAIQVLRAGGVPQSNRRTSLDERMSRVKTPVVGSNGGGLPNTMTVAEQIIQAGKKRRGEI